MIKLKSSSLGKKNGTLGQSGPHDDVAAKRFMFMILPFIFGLIAVQKIIVVGEIYIGELIAVLYFSIQFKGKSYLRLEKKFIFLCLTWAGAQLLSDVVNDTNLKDSFKGVFAPIVFSFATLGLVTYFRININRMPSFLLGVSVGGLLVVTFFPDSYAQVNPWKWGLGTSIVSIIAIYSSFFQQKKPEILLSLVLIIFFIISIQFDARSLAIFPLISIFAYVVVKRGDYSRFSRVFSGNWGVSRLLLFIVPLFLVLNSLMSFALSSTSILDSFSYETAEKYRGQASGTYGALLGGRSEILVSSRAFLDSPLLGHGSWAKDKTGKYINEYFSRLSQLGYAIIDDSASFELGLIPVHSYLMGSFVWAGIFGGLFWLFLLNQTIKTFARFISKLPYYYFLGMFLLFWNIFFSPFGASARWTSAVFLSSYFAFLFELLKQADSKS